MLITIKLAMENCLFKIALKNINAKLQFKIAMKYNNYNYNQTCNENLQCKIAFRNCKSKLHSKILMQNCNEKLQCKIAIHNYDAQSQLKT
jgi:hypothetical protein